MSFEREVKMQPVILHFSEQMPGDVLFMLYFFLGNSVDFHRHNRP